MGTTLQTRIFMFVTVLFVVLLASCSQENKNAYPSVDNEIPSSITPSQTLTPSSSLFLSSTPTFDYAYATFAAQFPAIKAREAATQTAAYAMLASRNAVCDNGYHLIFSPEDMVRALDFFTTNLGESWTVIECLPDKSNPSKEYTKVFNSVGSNSWKISSETLPLTSDYEGLSGYTITSNGDFLYLVASCFCAQGDGWGGPLGFFGYGAPLYRLNLSSGELSPVLPFINDGFYVDMSISPDVRYLVWSRSRDNNIFFIRDLISGDVKTIELSNIYGITGDFTWSPDGKYLVFAAGVNGLEDAQAGISLFRLTLKTMYLQPLILNDKRDFVPWFNSDTSKIWLSDNILNLGAIGGIGEHDFNSHGFSSNKWAININTGQLIPLSTPTPTP